MSIPILLTKQQRHDIINSLDGPKGVGKKAVAIARNHFVKRVDYMLKRIKLVPKEPAFVEFKDTIQQSFYESLVESGSPVGVIAGVSLGGPITQLSLNSFHFAGALSGVALAFQKVRDFLTGSKIPRDPQMKIFFKSPEYHPIYQGTDIHDTLHVGTFDSIMAMKPEIEQITVKDLVVGRSDILTHDQAIAEGVDKLLDLHSQLRSRRIPNKDNFRLTNVLCLTLNTYRMYTHKITMDMLAKAIEGAQNPPDSIVTLWKSQIAGRIYIVADETKNYGLDTISGDAALPMFLRSVVKSFSDFIVSGVKDILSLDPVKVNITDGIYRYKKLEGGLYRVYTNNHKTRWMGISLADLHNFFTNAGFNVHPELNKKKLYITVEYSKDIKKAVNELTEGKEFYIGATRGSNINEIVWRDDVDCFRTIGNHSHEIAETQGIDAAQLYMITRFVQMFNEFGAEINNRHISLIFNLLCNLGIINSLSFVGVNRRNVGALEMASYEKAVYVMIRAAMANQRDTVDGVSPSVYLAQPSTRVGTGSHIVIDDPTLMVAPKPTLPTFDELSLLPAFMPQETIISFEDLFKRDVMVPIMPEPAPIDKAKIVSDTPILTTEMGDITELEDFDDLVLLPPPSKEISLESTLTFANTPTYSRTVPSVSIAPLAPLVELEAIAPLEDLAALASLSTVVEPLKPLVSLSTPELPYLPPTVTITSITATEEDMLDIEEMMALMDS